MGVQNADRQNAGLFTRGSAPWGAAQRDTPWLDVHGDGYWIRCYRTGHNSFEWFLALRSGQGYESTQPSSIRTEAAADQANFPGAILDSFFEIAIALAGLDHADGGLEIETGLGTLVFNRGPFETRETDILHFPRPRPLSIDAQRVPHVLRLVKNSRPAPKKKFFRRAATNAIPGQDAWLDFEIDGRLLSSRLEQRGAGNPTVIDSCDTYLRASRGGAAVRQLDCLAGLRLHES